MFAGCSLSTYLLTNVLAGQLDPARFASEYQVGSYDALLGALPDTLATRILGVEHEIYWAAIQRILEGNWRIVGRRVIFSSEA